MSSLNHEKSGYNLEFNSVTYSTKYMFHILREVDYWMEETSHYPSTLGIHPPKTPLTFPNSLYLFMWRPYTIKNTGFETEYTTLEYSYGV